MKIPHTIPFKWDQFASTGFTATIHTTRPTGPAIVLLGLPDDTGVKLNHGRIGAAAGPTAFRAALSKLGVRDPAGKSWPVVFDAGDVEPGDTLDETHGRVTAAADALVDAGWFPVAVGGGHDLTFPFVRATAKKYSPLTGVYFDAHLDVRDTVGSGMAFRRLVETSKVRSLHLHGFRPLVNARDHLAWFSAHGGKVHDDEEPVRLPAGKDLFASFDLDVLDMAVAPGVSARNPSGWTPREAERWVQACGADPRVRCFDLMELCPPHDEGGRTARLAAHLFLTFLAGFAERP